MLLEQKKKSFIANFLTFFFVFFDKNDVEFFISFAKNPNLKKKKMKTQIFEDLWVFFHVWILCK